MQKIVRSGSVDTGPVQDYTVKIDADRLAPGRDYFYRFTCDGQDSVVGKTRTLPRGPIGQAKFGIVSCSNYPAGFFNVYREISKRQDLDVVLHLGDYIYEYGQGEYATENAESLGRVPEPPHEILTLSDYRHRHAQYKTDQDSQAMHASVPVIAVWDDHEVANDSWKDGAQNHQADEGEWAARRDAALQAYFEWMPIRGTTAGANTKIYREFRWGDLASVIMLDTRLIGRDKQPNVGEDVTRDSVVAALKDPGRRMLGAEQEKWFRDTLRNVESTTWQLIGQQVMVGRMEPPDLDPLVDRETPSYYSPEVLDAVIEASKSHAPQVLDVWDGYPVARDDFLRDLRDYAKNAVVLSGDLHTSLAGNLVLSGEDHPVAVEMMTGPVSSPTLTSVFPDKVPNGVRDGTLQQNPNMRFLDIAYRGWLAVTLTPDECTGEWHLVDTVLSRNYKSWLEKRLTVRAGQIDKGLI
jgi:alkaline phosphatase D